MKKLLALLIPALLLAGSVRAADFDTVSAIVNAGPRAAGKTAVLDLAFRFVSEKDRRLMFTSSTPDSNIWIAYDAGHDEVVKQLESHRIYRVSFMVETASPVAITGKLDSVEPAKTP